MWQEFKAIAIRGNAIYLAVGDDRWQSVWPAKQALKLKQPGPT
jgi:hypothetical protein